MGFLKRVTGAGGSPPPWCQHLTSRQYASLRDAVRSVLDRDLSSDAELADATYAEGYYRLITLARLAGEHPEDAWATFVRDDLTQSRERKTLGDEIEARSRTLEAAVPSLRLALYRPEWVPSGDLSVPSTLPGFVEAVVLDTGPSVRNVPDRLASGWGVDLETIAGLARDQVRRLPVERATREHAGHPLVRSVSIEAQGPYAGVLLRDLPEVAPDAIGALGSLVGVPASGGFFYVALASTESLRQDLFDLAILHSMVESKTARPLAKLPMWRRLDGSFVEVPLKLDEREGVLGSYHPGFEGVLTTLDPLTFLPVAPWAQGTLTVQQYTRFAGLVSVARDVRPEEVTLLGSAWALAELAARCRRIDVDAWPAIIAAYTAEMRADAASAQAIVDAWRTDPAGVRDHLAVYLADDAAVRPGMTVRPTILPGVSEVLCVYAADATAQLPPDAAASMGPIDQSFQAGGSAVRAAIERQPMTETLLTGGLIGIRSRPAASAVLPHLLEWVPEAAGPGGALVSIARSELMVALPVADRSFVLDLPEFIGLAFGMYEAAEWPGTHAAYWVRPDGISAIDARVGPTGRVIGVRADPDLARRVMDLPEGPVPTGLAGGLGAAEAARFLGLLRAAVLDRLAEGETPLVLTRFNIRDFADWCSEVPSDRWAEVIRQRFVDTEPDRAMLDALEDGTDVAAIRAALSVRTEVGSGGRGPMVERSLPGGVVARLGLTSGNRRRNVRHRMLEHWGIAEDAAWSAAAANLAAHPGLVDEPMPGAPAFSRQIYHPDFEAEAVGLYLHLRSPGTQRGFVVSITHGSRAHYLRLDDRGALPAIPVFATVIRGIYEEAARHQDALSPWLFWLRRDGAVVPLFDVREPLPDSSAMPADFRALSMS